MTDMTINERLKAIREDLVALGSQVIGNEETGRIARNLDAIQSTIAAAETDAGKLYCKDERDELRHKMATAYERYNQAREMVSNSRQDIGMHYALLQFEDFIKPRITAALLKAKKPDCEYACEKEEGEYEIKCAALLAENTMLKAGQDAQAWKERAEKEHELRLAVEVKAALSEKPNIDKLVDKFLMWKLPESVCSDTCVSDRNYKFQRNGTNLLSAYEAKQMIEYLLDISPPLSQGETK